MIFIDLASTTLSQQEMALLTHPFVSGIVLFKRNIDSTDQLAELISHIKVINPKLSIAIDQEGGIVQRLREGVAAIPAMRSFGKIYDESPQTAIERIAECAWLVGSELSALGIDINFAPVVDVDAGISTIIGDRAFHSDPNVIVTLCQTYIDVMMSTGVMPVLKHFPGHGHVRLDSHIDQPVDTRDIDAVWECDVLPYRELHYPAVMMSHVIFSEADTMPAGFSTYWVKTLLREQLRFSGIIFSDALDMSAAAVVGDMEDRVLAALKAGCNIVLVCNHGEARQALLASLGSHPQMKENYRPFFIPVQNKTETMSLSSLQQTTAYKEIRARIEGILS